MNAERGTRNRELKERTFDFGVHVVRLAQMLPKNVAGNILARQLIRSGTAVGANYRAAKRARSAAEFVAKLGIVEEECDETAYWIELLISLDFVKRDRVADLLQETNELVAIVVASIKTARRR